MSEMDKYLSVRCHCGKKRKHIKISGMELEDPLNRGGRNLQKTI